jgi:hypothetical protein
MSWTQTSRHVRYEVCCQELSGRGPGTTAVLRSWAAALPRRRWLRDRLRSQVGYRRYSSPDVPKFSPSGLCRRCLPTSARTCPKVRNVESNTTDFGSSAGAAATACEFSRRCRRDLTQLVGRAQSERIVLSPTPRPTRTSPLRSRGCDTCQAVDRKPRNELRPRFGGVDATARLPVAPSGAIRPYRAQADAIRAGSSAPGADAVQAIMASLSAGIL